MERHLLMYNHLRKYLSPLTAYDLVKIDYPRCNLGVMEFEMQRLKGRFKFG